MNARSDPQRQGTSLTPNLIARLEKELRDLWAPTADPTAIPKSRVCTMNLEVVAGSRDLLERYLTALTSR